MSPSEQTADGSQSRTALGLAAYCLGGGVVALAYGLWSLRGADDVNTLVWLGAAAFGGILAGAVLYGTRSWHDISRFRAVVRWALAGLVAGVAGGIIAAASGESAPLAIAVGGAFGSVALVCWGVYWHQDEWLVSVEPRTPTDVARTWLPIIVIALVLGLVAWFA